MSVRTRALRCTLLLALLFASDPVPAIADSRTYDPTEVLVAPAGRGRIWYVDGASGSDANTGLSEAAAFRTIGRAVNGSSAPIAPGDTVRIKAGHYRERLNVVKAGTPTDRIVIGPFGDGEVIVDASDAVTGWTLQSGQIYRAIPGFKVTAVVVDDTPLFPEFSLSALTESKYYYDTVAGALYVWAPGAGNPATHDLGVIKDQEYEPGVFVNWVDYVTLYGLTVRFAGGHGVQVLGNHVRVEKSRLTFNGKGGVSVFAYQNVSSTDAEIVKNYISFNVMRNWPRGRYKWGGWPGAASSQWAPNTLFQGNISRNNGGEGLLAYGGLGGTVFRDNIVSDNWSVSIYIDNQPNGIITNNLISCHDPDLQDLYNNGDPTPGDGVALRRLRPEGIMTADEEYFLTPPANLQNVLIANNVILNCRRGIHHYAKAAGSGLRNVHVLNNTITVPNILVPGESHTFIAGISIPSNNGNNTGAVYKNNLVYASLAGTYVLHGSTANPPGPDQFAGLTMNHNLWYHTTSLHPFHWGVENDTGYDSDFVHWLALPGALHGEGDVFADPKLIDVASDDPLDKRPASATSPAVDSGTPVCLPTDYDYRLRPAAVSHNIGALEFGTPAAPVINLCFNRDTYRPGDQLQLDITVANPGPEQLVDVYFGAFLPSNAGPSFGCPGLNALALLDDSLHSGVITCTSAPPQTFPAILRGVSVPATLALVTLRNFWSFVWPTSLPPGTYTFFLALTRAHALADGRIDATDLVTFAKSTIIISP